MTKIKKPNSKKLVFATFESQSPEQTKKIGRQIAKAFKSGDVVALYGDLGAGKTTLVKGIATGLGVKNEDAVSSPTFALIHEYQGRVKVYHIDWYRLEGVRNADLSFAEECFGGEGVTLVEWAGRGDTILPKNRWEIVLKMTGKDCRKIQVKRLS